ncbi:MAG: carnitine dehydratase [Nisaea sp.]|nr:carnitine dehydratase [Nisaea sp.]OUY00004.1 MAG: carnitine dehydratase [Candidatus Endolissoclinum sp. TMED26]
MGPLKGLKIIEMVGIGPAPHGCMMLADMGAEIIRVDRPGGNALGGSSRGAVLNRGRKSIALDLKKPAAVEAVLKLIENADGLVEGFRPGVMERLGLGPEVCLARNPRLVFGRMTGWGQDGPLAKRAGHDINYIALTGALDSIGDQERGPVPPLNLVGDFGGGGMMLAFGMVCGLLEAKSSGKGQVVDAAMVDGAAALMAGIYSAKGVGRWPNRPRGENWLDGGAHFYGSYECADGNWICIGSIEPQFYALLRQTLGLDGAEWDDQWTPEGWPALKQKLVDIFKTKSRAEWTEIMGDTDICFAPVMAMDEVLDHPHIAARQTFIHADDVLQPAPAPRFSRTAPEIQSSPAFAGEHNDEVLSAWGFADADIAALKAKGALADPS